MGVMALRRRRTLLGGASYANIISNTFGSALVDYRKLDELSGTAAVDSSPKLHADGTYSGVTLDAADGPSAAMGRVGSWDGINDYCNIYSAALNTDFDEAAGTAAIWMKVSGAGVWTDATERQLFNLGVNTSNFVRISKSTTSNQIQFRYVAGGTVESVTHAISSVNWVHVALTWSVASDEVKAFVDGAQTGTTQTSLGTWSGALLSSLCAIGAQNTSGTAPFSGNVAHFVLLNRVATTAEVLTLATAV